jgi:hypothetical protein
MTIRRSSLLWVLIPLAVLLLAGIAYASSSVIRERFASLFPQVERTGLAQEMDLKQTIDGVTVRIERVYVDSNAALVGYTISGPPTTTAGPGSRYSSTVRGLAVDGGPVLPLMFASLTVPGSKDVLGDWNPSDRLAVVAAFDASAVQGSPTALKVRMLISLSDSVPVPQAGQATSGIFAFDFKAKLHPGKVVNVGQTLNAAGVSITLEQLVISHWATRPVFRFDPPYDNREYRPALVASMVPAGGSPVDISGLFYGDFTSQTGEWTLTINEMVFFRGLPPGVDIGVPKDENGQIRPKGPWVFHFNVP